MKNKIQFSDLEKNEIISEYDTGKSSPQTLAKKYNCSFIPIYRILKENNIQIKPEGFFQKGIVSWQRMKLPEAEIVKLYLEGMSTNKLAEKYGGTEAVMNRLLRRNNIQLNHKGFIKGQKFTEEHRLNMSKSFIGERSKKQALRMKELRNHKEFYGEEYIKKLSLSQLKRHKEKPLSQSEKDKISKSLMGHPVLEATREKIIEARKTQVFPLKDSFIEIKIQNYLKQLNVEFFTHQYMRVIEHGYQCDMIIPSMNLIIECDGDYWHANPIFFPHPTTRQESQINKDRIRTAELIAKGFKVLRLWECEINKMSVDEFKTKLENGGK